MANEDIRNLAKEKGIPHWRIAEELNTNECSLSRKLRHELSQEDKFLIESIINKLSKETE